MKKLIIALSVALVVFSCKKDGNQPTNNKESKEEVKVEKKVESAFLKDSEGAYVFNFNLEEGNTYPFSITTKGNVVQTDGKKSDKVSQESVTALDYTVTQVKDSSYVMQVKFVRFKEEMNGPNGKISYDTNAEKPTNEMAAQQWQFNKAIVGKPFSMEISKDGKVLDVTKLLSVRNAVKEALKSDLNPEQLQGLDQVLNQTLSVEAMQAMFQESTSYYPKKPVKIGETWSKKEGTDKAGSTMDYTFKGIENGVVTITINGKSKGTDSQTNQQGVSMFRSLEGNVDGAVTINEKTGWIDSAKIDKEEVVRITQQYKGRKANFSSTTNTVTTINQ